MQTTRQTTTDQRYIIKDRVPMWDGFLLGWSIVDIRTGETRMTTNRKDSAIKECDRLNSKATDHD